MDAFRSHRRSPHRALLFGTFFILLALLTAPADARTRRRQKPSAFRVALQPFSLVRSAVHAVGDPIVHHAPRLVAAAATAPLRAAYHVARAESAEIPRDKQAGEDEGDDPVDERDYNPATTRSSALHSAEPIRVAYVVPQNRNSLPPRAEPIDEDENEEPLNTPREETRNEDSGFESSGSKPMVAGSRAVLRNGIAYAPSQAPQAVKNAIWAANTLRNKPYVWGGGHSSFYDRGYDCSGTVSFALRGAGAIGSPVPSSDLMRYGERGRGRWFTIYSRRGHTFAVIAGLRLDTTDFQNGGNSGPRWHADMRDTRGYVARHPAGM